MARKTNEKKQDDLGDQAKSMGHVPGAAVQSGEDDITQTLIPFMPPRRIEQRVGITQGPYDPGLQPVMNSDNRLMLGLYGWNVSCGVTISKAVLDNPPKLRDFHEWETAQYLIKESERIGFEFELPIARMRGSGGKIGFHEDSIDSLCQAPALAQVTSKIGLFSTVMMGSHFHPLHIAKMGANFDHISDGRWGINIVAGWNRTENELFGLGEAEEVGLFNLTSIDHNMRYEMTDEFITLIKQTWALQSNFEFNGRFYRGGHIYIYPKPARQPRPFILHSGSSPESIEFAARNCDWLLCRTTNGSWNEVRAVADRAKKLAAIKFGRHLQTFTYVYVIAGQTDGVAESEYENVRSQIDTKATDTFVREVLDRPGEFDGILDPTKVKAGARSVKEMVGEDNYTRCALGLGAMPLVGSHETVAEKMRVLADDYGMDGLALSFFDPIRGLQETDDYIIPRLKKMALRKWDRAAAPAYSR